MRRNYEKFAGQVFALIDTNNAAINDTNLYNACLAFTDDDGTNAILQVQPFGLQGVLIKASHFDYSTETRDFALLVCDDVAKPTWKTLDFAGASDAQDGWLVQGIIPHWKVTETMFFVVSNISQNCNAFFRAIPYSGPQIQLSGPQPYDIVSNTISIYAQVTDLSGVTGERFEVSIDGSPAQVSLEASNTISLNTKYNPAGICNVYLKAHNKASVYNPTNTLSDNAKLYFESSASLPLDFENDTYLLFGSDNASPDIGTNYFMYVIDKAQEIEAYIEAPSDGRMVAYFHSFVPYPATIQIPWNFTEADGVTPYSNDTYIVTFTAFDPTTIIITNKIDREGVRAGAGCFLTYQEEDPMDMTGNYLNQQADIWINDTLKMLYTDLYKPLSFTQYTPGQVGTNRNHSVCQALDSSHVSWADFMQPALSNLNYSDLTIAQAHGTGFEIGGGGYLLNRFNSQDLLGWIKVPAAGHNWRLRKAAIWSCWSGTTPLETGDFSFPQACGMRPWQDRTYTRKNCGLFFGGTVPQGGFGGTSTTTAKVAAYLDQAWICGQNQYPGGCDPTYSFRFAINATRNMYNPELDYADPRLYGLTKMIYSSIYDDELNVLDFTHVKDP